MKIQMCKAFSPASVGNIASGFDLLGHSLSGPGDTVTARRIDLRDEMMQTLGPVSSRVIITKISGVVQNLPMDAVDNTAGQAVLAMLQAQTQIDQKNNFAIELEIEKGIPLGSGMGGSAASAVAAVVAANRLMPTPFDRQDLYRFALEGERVASGAAHGDNIGAQLFGGVALSMPDRVVSLMVPEGLYCAHVHPHCVLETRRAREALQGAYAIKEFVAQSEALACLLLGLQTGERDLLQRGLRDVLVEPRRAFLIPGFFQVKQAALDAGALGASISGAGPSLFAWCDDQEQAQRVAVAMQSAFAQSGLASDVLVSLVAGPRAEVLECR